MFNSKSLYLLKNKDLFDFFSFLSLLRFCNLIKLFFDVGENISVSFNFILLRDLELLLLILFLLELLIFIFT